MSAGDDKSDKYTWDESSLDFDDDEGDEPPTDNENGNDKEA